MAHPQVTVSRFLALTPAAVSRMGPCHTQPGKGEVADVVPLSPFTLVRLKKIAK